MSDLKIDEKHGKIQKCRVLKLQERCDRLLLHLEAESVLVTSCKVYFRIQLRYTNFNFPP